MHLYVVLLASPTMKPVARLITLFLMSHYHLRYGRYEVMLYFLSACLAQVELLWQTSKKHGEEQSKHSLSGSLSSRTAPTDLILQGLDSQVATFLVSACSPRTYAFRYSCRSLSDTTMMCTRAQSAVRQASWSSPRACCS